MKTLTVVPKSHREQTMHDYRYVLKTLIQTMRLTRGGVLVEWRNLLSPLDY